MRAIFVERHNAGERLDLVISKLLGVTRSQAERMVDDKLVKVNGQAEQRRYKLKANDELQIEDSPVTAIILPKLSVVYEDDDLLVVDKAAGTLTHPGSRHTEGTLADAVRPLVEGEGNRPGIVHRLDRDTSGLVVIAKTIAAKTYLQTLFHDRKINKTYIALVAGEVIPPEAVIKLPLGRSLRNQVKQTVQKQGRMAVTKYSTLHNFSEFTLLEVQPQTGRTHQIRVHLQALGYPIVGDSLYGSASKLPGLKRQFLHASRLQFISPNGQNVDVHSPLPQDLSQVLDRLT